MNAAGWKQLFTAWPQDMPRRGVLVTNFAEQFPFDGFLIGEELLFVERQTPDSLGSRAMFLPYDNIAAVKLTDVVKPKPLQTLGLKGDLSKK